MYSVHFLVCSLILSFKEPPHNCEEFGCNQHSDGQTKTWLDLWRSNPYHKYQTKVHINGTLLECVWIFVLPCLKH